MNRQKENKELKRAWWKESVVYQIYPRSFMDSNGDGIGDIPGIISKLDYLKELGIDVIWLSPVYQSPNADNGYDISDYRQIMKEFGTLEDLERLIDEAHKRSIKLIMDLVVNHTSDEHPWFAEAKSSRDSPFRDYYIWKDGIPGTLPNNWESHFSGSAWEYDEASGQYYLHIFSTKQPDLNWENPDVRKEVMEIARYWLDKKIDGFRMDTINFISKVPGFPSVPDAEGLVRGHDYYMNGPKVHDYLKELNREVLSHYDIMTVGETPNVTPQMALEYVGEDRGELNMVFQFEHVNVDSGKRNKWDIVPWDLKKFKSIIVKWQKDIYGKGWNSLYLSNHDQPRSVSRFGNDGVYHDESAKMLATMIHTLQGTPYIYQGEELGMTNVKFPDITYYKDIQILNLYRDMTEKGFQPEEIMRRIYYRGRDNARTPMQWNSRKNAGFSEGTPWLSVNPNYREINAEDEMRDSGSVLRYYQKLIRLRKEYQIIVYGDFKEYEAESEEVFVYERNYQGQKLLVVLNFKDKTPELENRTGRLLDEAEILISNYPAVCREEKILLRPYEARVYYWKNQEEEKG